MEKIRHALAVVCAADGLGEDGRNIKHFNLGTLFQFLFVWTAVCHLIHKQCQMWVKLSDLNRCLPQQLTGLGSC